MCMHWRWRCPLWSLDPIASTLDSYREANRETNREASREANREAIGVTCMRNSLGWLETRLAQITLNCREIA